MSFSLDQRRKIRALVEPTIRRLGFELVGVEGSSDGRGALLRLSIDGPSGVSIGDCARVSRQLDPLLDAEDPIAGSYTLEVSSPGIKRPVERLQDFQRFSGYKVRMRLVEGPPRRRYAGILRGVEGQDVLVECEGVVHRIAMDLVDKANLDLDLAEYEALAVSASSGASLEDQHDHE